MFICTLHRYLHIGVNMNLASDEAIFCKIQTRYMYMQAKNFTLKVLSEVIFMIFVFLVQSFKETLQYCDEWRKFTSISH